MKKLIMLGLTLMLSGCVMYPAGYGQGPYQNQAPVSTPTYDVVVPVDALWFWWWVLLATGPDHGPGPGHGPGPRWR